MLTLARTSLVVISALAAAVACSSSSSSTKTSDGVGGSPAGGDGGTSVGGSGDSTTGGGTSGGAAGEAGAEGDVGGNAGGSNAGTGGTSATGEDRCDTDEATPNDDLDSAVSYSVGTEYAGCIQTADDVDFYEFSVPELPGYVTVSVTDVGTNGNIDVRAYTLADDGGELVSTYTGNEGESRYLHFASYPGAAYAVSVQPWSSIIDGPNPYVFSVAFHEIEDPYEPDNLRSEAKTIEVGEEVEAYMYAGFETSTSIADVAWYDWFEVELATGDVSVLLEIFANDANSELELYDPLGIDLSYAFQSTDGASVLLEHTIEEAGSYFVRVGPWSGLNPRGGGLTPPQYLTVPYTLTVTQ